MKALWLVWLALCGVVAPAHAEVLRTQLTSAIVEREPTDDLRGEVIGKDDVITEVFFFTQLENMQGQPVQHRWLYQGKLMAEVTLPVKGPNWRTWSSKKLLPGWQGDWQVQVWSGETLLLSQDFVFTLVPAGY